MADVLSFLYRMATLPDALTMSRNQARLDDSTTSQALSEMSAKSKIAGGSGGFDPLSPGGGKFKGSPIIWNPPPPPTGNVSLMMAPPTTPSNHQSLMNPNLDSDSAAVPSKPADQNSTPSLMSDFSPNDLGTLAKLFPEHADLINLTSSVKAQLGDAWGQMSPMERFQAVDSARNGAASVPTKYMGAIPGTNAGDVPTQANYDNEQRRLAAQAFPAAAMATLQNKYFPAPLGKMAAGESYMGVVDPTTGKAPVLATAPAMPPETVRSIAAVQAALKAAPLGSLDAQTYQAALNHLLGIETDPNKVNETLASIGEKNASADYHRRMADSLTTSTLAPATIENIVDQMHLGNQAAINQVGNSRTSLADRRAIMNRFAEKYPDGADAVAGMVNLVGQKAGMRTAATRSAQTSGALKEVDALADQALSASRAVGRGDFVPINQLTNYARSQTSNPAYGQLDVAIQGLKTAYGQALARNGVQTDAIRAKTDKLFDGARSHADLQARIEQARKETASVLGAMNSVQSDITGQISGRTPSAGPASPVRVWNPQTGRLE